MRVWIQEKTVGAAVKNDVAALLAEYAELPEYSELVLDDVGTTSLFGNKPINIAATRGIMAEVDTLLSVGVDVNNRGEHGYMPLHDAVEQGHLDVVRRLIEEGADPYGKTDDGTTPVELAVMLKEHDIEAFLRSL